jgi:hypothetical protein
MVFKYIILYANIFDNSAISLVNVDVVFFSNFSYHRQKIFNVFLAYFSEGQGWSSLIIISCLENLFCAEFKTNMRLRNGYIFSASGSEGGIAGCGISLHYHTLLWWAVIRKVREKYHIYIYQWKCRIIKEICIKYNIFKYHSSTPYHWQLYRGVKHHNPYHNSLFK